MLFVRQNRARLVACMIVLLSVLGGRPVSTLHAAEPVDAGYRTLSFGGTCNSTPTGEKPESKLWFHDGYWWGSLCNGSANEYHIYRFDVNSQDWLDTQVVLDDRPNTKADVLWDASAQKLYVASHVFTSSGSASSTSSNWARLYRYSYNSGNKSYALDSGFPVHVSRGRSETITLAKDAAGKLWVTYVENGKVMVNHSNSSDSDWGSPYQLPVSGSDVDTDDISAIIAYENYIGIMWSNQDTKVMYFARHDSNSSNDQSWQSVSAYHPGGSGADDHINLKALHSDSAGRIFAVTKTSFSSPDEPLILLLVCAGPPCTSVSQWSAHLVYKEENNDTRPILLIDTDNRDLHVFTTDTGSGGKIRHKMSDLDNISFPSGEGELFIASGDDSKINNPTSTKQSVTSQSGILVLASSQTTNYYYHNYIDLGGGGGGGGGPTNTPPTVDAGAGQTVALSAGATLNGTASDDGQVSPLSTTWSQLNGPAAATIANATALNTAVTFSAAGLYEFQLTASDGEHQVSDSVSITVNDDSGGGGSGGAATFAAVADALVKSSSATSNYGGDSQLRLRGGSSPYYNSYLQFNVSGLGGAVQSARLRLYVTDGSDSGGTVYAVSNNGSNGAPWTEGGISWSNAPTIGGAPLSTLGAINNGQWAEYDVTAAVTGNGLYSFGITATSSNSAYFSSKEGGQAPELVITYGGGGGGPTNTPPTVDAGAGQTVALSAGATLNGTASDDGQVSPLSTTWSQLNGPAAATIANATALNTAVTFSAAGLYEFQLTASDGEHQVSDSVSITVNDDSGGPSNTPPTVDAGAGQTVALSAGATLNGTASDDGQVSPLSTTWSQLNGPAAATIANATALNTAVTFSAAGLYEFQLTASDGEHQVSDSVSITVNDDSGGGGSGGAATFAAVADALVKSSSATSNYGGDSQLRLRGGSSPYYNSYLQFNVSGLGGAVQSARLRLYVTDGSDSGGTVYAVSNNGSNGAPWTEGGISWSNAPTIGGAPLSTLGAINNGQWAEYDVTAAVTGNGLYSFGITATSSNSAYFSSKEGGQAPELVITYGGGGGGGGPTNTPPTVDAGAGQTVALSAGATLNGTASDDGQVSPLSTTWSQLNGPATATIANATALNTAVTFSAAGLYEFQLTASDGEHQVSDSVSITVNDDSGGPSNTPPTVDAGAGQTVALSAGATLNGTASDDGQVSPLSTTWSQLNGPAAATIANATALNTAVTFSAAGLYEFQLTASDGEHQVSDSVSITVNDDSGGGGSGSAATFAAVADALVKSSSATRNYGDVSTIRLRDTDPFYNSYLQFNVTGISTPIQSARLRLYVTDASDSGGSVYAVSNSGSNGAPWTESTITWENGPVIGGSPLSTLGAVESDTWVEFDVTAAVTGDGVYSFGLNTASTNSVLYSAKEGAYPPELVVTYGGTSGVQSSADESQQAVRRLPSIDRPESLLDAQLVQELQQLGGGVLIYTPIIGKP